MGVDAAQRGALAAYLVDQKGQHQEDRGAREAVPETRRENDARTRKQVRPDPRACGEKRDEHRGRASKPPAREPNWDEVEDREAEVRTRRDVDEPDDGHPGRREKGERHDTLAASYVEVRDAAWCGLRSQNRVTFTHPARV